MGGDDAVRRYPLLRVVWGDMQQYYIGAPVSYQK